MMMEYVMRVYVQHDLAGLPCFDLFYTMIIWISWSLAWEWVYVWAMLERFCQCDS